MPVLYTPHFAQFLDSNGDPLPGGKLYTYAAGTTTPKATYTTAAGTVENANPVVLDSSGRATIFIDGAYRFDLYDAGDVLIKSTDNVTSFTTTGAAANAFYESFSGDGATVSFTASEDLGTDEKLIFVFADLEYALNGAFATDTGWTKGTGWTIGSGVATATGAISTDLEQDAAKPLIEGELYRISMTITRSAGSITPEIGGTAGTARSSSGTYHENIIAGATQKITFATSGFTGTVDNVSVTKVSGQEILKTSDYTIDGTTLTLTVAPTSGTNNVQVWAPTKAANAASVAAAAAEASAAQALTNANAGGFSWDYSTTITEADPGTGEVRFNNATLASATEVYISHTTANSQDVDDWLATWDDPTSTIKGTLRVFKQAAPENFAVYHVTGTETDNTTWSKFTVAYVTGGGSLIDGDTLGLWFIRNGDKGDTGAQGAPGTVSGAVAATAASNDLVLFKDVDNSDALSEDTFLDAVAATLLDEDDMASNSATRAPTQQSVKAYVDNNTPDSGLVLLGSYTASKATSVDIGSGLDLDAAIDGTYDEYIIKFHDVSPANNGVDLYMRTDTNGGASFDASGYAWGLSYIVATGSEGGIGSASTSQIEITDSAITNGSAAYSVSGEIVLHNPAGTTKNKLMSIFTVSNYAPGSYEGHTGFGAKASTAAIDAVRFYFSSGNISTGSFYLYGIRKS